MKLAVFGCSWSYGTNQQVDIEKSPPNWVRCLAKIRPDISITNFAFGGTSVQFSAFLFDKYAKEHDYTIFQITSPYRFTLWPEQFDFKEHMIKYEDNLTQLDNELYSDILNVSPAQIEIDPSWKLFFKHSRNVINFSKQYYKYMDSEYLWFEYNMFIEHITKQADLRFFHRIDPKWPLRDETYNTWCIQKILPAQQYQDYLLDDGDHFNQAGCEWQANYINDKYLQ